MLNILINENISQRPQYIKKLQTFTDIPCEYAFLKKLTKPEKFFVVGRNSACNVFLFTSDRLGALDEFLLGYDIINEQECADDMKPMFYINKTTGSMFFF